MSFGTKATGDDATAAWANLIEDALGDGNPAGLADYIIFTSGATTYARNGTDGTIDYSGTDDRAVIQSVIDALGSDGGIILIKKGTYSIDAALTITNNGIILQGEGHGERTKKGTIFEATNFSGWVVDVQGGAGGIYSVELRDIGIWVEDKANVTGGVLFQDVLDSKLVRCSIIVTGTTSGIAVKVEGNLCGAYNNAIEHCHLQSDGSSAVGISCVGSAQNKPSNMLTVVGGRLAGGVSGIQGTGVRLGDWAAFNQMFGTYLDGWTRAVDAGDTNTATYNHFIGVRPSDNTYDFYFRSTAHYNMVFVSSYSQYPHWTGGSPVCTYDAGQENVFLGSQHGTCGLKMPIEHHTAVDTLTINESGSVHTNLGAGGAVTLTLPQNSGIKGVAFEFVVMTAQELRIDPGAAGAIYINGAKQTDDKYISADDEGESVKLVADGNNDWIAIGAVGTWSVEA